MTTTALLPVGTTQATSATFAVASGATVTVHLRGTPSIPLNADVTVQILDSDANPHAVGSLSQMSVSLGQPTQVAASISAPGTYQVTRNATGAAVGVDLES